MAWLGSGFRKIAGEAGNAPPLVTPSRQQAQEWSLPVELRAHLPDAGIASVGDDSEARAAYVPHPGSIHKLRVVEDVEKFQTDIESVVLLNYGPLRKSEIGVVESRAVEEASAGGPKSAQIGVNGERGG